MAEGKGKRNKKEREEGWFENKEEGDPGYIAPEDKERERQGANTPRLAEALRTLEERNTPGTLSDPYYRGRRDAIKELAESGGLIESRVGLEVLLLLPDRFVQFYSDLFHRALRGGDSQAVTGKGGGIEKAKGSSGGMVLGSDTRLQAQGSGKRYKNPSSALGSDKALKLKHTIDKELIALVRTGGEVLYRSKEVNEAEPSSTSPQICTGSLPGLMEGREDEVRRCSRFLKRGWNYCPNCGAEVKG